MTDAFLGEIRMVGFNYAPPGWAFCDGSLLMISSNTALFALLGTTYGGDGRTNFALPDLRGRVPVSWGQAPGLSRYELGERSGAETETITLSHMPAHQHALPSSVSARMSVSIPAYSKEGNDPAPGPDNVLAAMGAGLQAVEGYSSETADTNLKPTTAGGTLQLSGDTGSTGSGQPVNVVQPYLTVNFIICVSEGIFPPHS